MSDGKTRCQQMLDSAQAAGTLYAERFRGETNDLIRAERERAALELGEVFAARWWWEYIVRNLTPERAYQEVEEVLDRHLEALKSVIMDRVNQRWRDGS